MSRVAFVTKSGQVFDINEIDKKACELWNCPYDKSLYAAPNLPEFGYYMRKNDGNEVSAKFEQRSDRMTRNWFDKLCHFFFVDDNHLKHREDISLLKEAIYHEFMGMMIWLDSTKESFYKNETRALALFLSFRGDIVAYWQLIDWMVHEKDIVKVSISG